MRLFAAIRNSSFLQVTATPYSLYLQPTEIEVANVITFKPTRPAFTKLVPVPAEYVGGETYFGESARSETDTLESLIHHTIDHREFDRLKRPDGRSFKLDDVLNTPAIEGLRTRHSKFHCGRLYSANQRYKGRGGRPKKLRYSDLAPRFRDGALVLRRRRTRDVIAVIRASSRLAAPERRTNSSRNCCLNASLLPDRLNSSKSLNVSMATSTADCSFVIVASLSAD
jgi:hypothetical protein